MNTFNKNLLWKKFQTQKIIYREGLGLNNYLIKFKILYIIYKLL